MLVDSHCHLNFDPLNLDTAGVLQRAKDNDVAYFLCVSVNLEDYPQVLELAQKHENIFASVGVHPNEQESEDPSVERLVELAKDDHVVAIGETGLDYFRSEGDLEWQRDRFRRHIQAAKEVKKPLIIHMRDAAEDTLKILKQEGANEIGGVMHCFTGDWETAQTALALNFYISFSGIVTFKSAEELREVARNVPEDRFLVETDCPYLAPVPHRGKTNEPAYVRFVAECLADLRESNYDQIARLSTDSFSRLFLSTTG